MKLKQFDDSFVRGKVKFIAGVDEAGRGPLAGPVVAAAVMFKNSKIIKGVRDSKKLSEKKREKLFDEIISSCCSYGIGIIEEKEIDEINILQATLKAMKTAVNKMNVLPHMILIDGNRSFNGNIPTKTIIKGDSKSFAIAAASIIAKVTRDRIMREAAKEFPNYVWHKNKGYGTREHINAIKKFGATPFHRKSFLTNIEESIQQDLPFNTVF